MIEHSHTPGPWTWGHEPFHSEYCGLFGQGGVVLDFDVYEGMGLAWNDSRDANARLIAAAPDLLEVAADAETLINGDLIGAEWKQACRAFLKKARATIAKATQP